MMQATRSVWSVFNADLPVLVTAYRFGPARVNALAVGGQSGLIVLSPPYRVQQRVFDELASYGPVRALVASNAFHNMGIPEWKQRFPAAAVFAPAQSIARVEAKTGIANVRPLADAKALTGAAVELTDMPYYRTGEALVRIRTPQGLAWYLTDLVINISELPPSPLWKLVFRLSYGVGLRYNRIGSLFMVRDKHALRQWLTQKYEKDRPRWLILAHGNVVDLAADPQAARSLFPNAR
jgi:hypothetical protein